VGSEVAAEQQAHHGGSRDGHHPAEDGGGRQVSPQQEAHQRREHDVRGVRSGSLAAEPFGEELGDFPLDPLLEVYLAAEQVGRWGEERGAGASLGVGR